MTNPYWSEWQIYAGLVFLMACFAVVVWGVLFHGSEPEPEYRSRVNDDEVFRLVKSVNEQRRSK